MRKLKEPFIVLDPEVTKSRIIMIAAEQFALKGYSTVSIRDIAQAAGIKSASIYFHFASKQEILESMMEDFERELHAFYHMLDKLSAKAGSLQEILHNIFAEVEENVNPFSYYVTWTAMNTMFVFEASHHLYYDVYFEQGRIAMHRQLEIAVERGLVNPFDTATCGSMITNCIITSISLHVGKHNGFFPDFNISTWCRTTMAQILRIAGEEVPADW